MSEKQHVNDDTDPWQDGGGGAKSSRTIADRWTEKLARHGFTPIANAFLDRYADLGITTSEAMLLVHLMRHKWDTAHPFPSAERVARRMGVTPTAVRNHARALEKKGMLVRLARGGKSNEYDLSKFFTKLEEAYIIKPQQTKK